MKIRWEDLLCEKTLAEKETAPSSWTDYPMDPFEHDYREIISSVSFRHLQDKAQVYQLGKGDYVRTRLTHSLEVSTVAKQLGTMLVYNDKWNRFRPFCDLTPEQARTIPTVLSCAGLLHDMGNPPFGHEGEYAIGAWFENRLADDGFEFFGKPIRQLFNEEMRADLCNFEGNAQVIRTLSRCRFPSEGSEANVTFATISSLIKYPVSSVEMNRSDPDVRVHKLGFFYSEKDLVKKVREATGLAIPASPHARNPLTYILEAADDIAYVASDIEDAVSKNTISINQLLDFMKKEIAALPADGDEAHQMRILTVEGIRQNLKDRIKKCGGDEGREVEALHKWTNFLRNWLMYLSAKAYVANGDAIMNGEYTGELLADTPHKYTVSILKKEMKKNVYPRLGEIHIAAHNILTGLLEKFGSAVIYWDTKRQIDPVSAAYLDIIPEYYKRAYYGEKTKDDVVDLYLRFRMVTDFITGMSDGRALELYKHINAFSY